MKNLIIIPARGGSKRLPQKNIKLLRNKPLIAYTIEAAKGSSIPGKLIVNTDDALIADVARKYGATVPFIRPSFLAQDNSTTIDVLKHTIKYYKNKNILFDNIILLQATSPFRSAIHINEAYDLFLKECKPVVSGILKKNENKLYKLSESLEPVKLSNDLFELNGAIYITSVENIENNQIFGDSFMPYYMKESESIDIDNKLDFLLAKNILDSKEGDENV